MLYLQGYKVINLDYKDKKTGDNKKLEIIELHCLAEFSKQEDAQGSRSVVESIPLTDKNLSKLRNLQIPCYIEIETQKNYAYKDARAFNTGFLEVEV